MNILVSASLWIGAALGVTVAIVIIIHSDLAPQFVERHWVVPLLMFVGASSIVVFYWRNPGQAGFGVGLAIGLILAYWFDYRFGTEFDTAVKVIRWTTRIVGFFLSFWAAMRIMPVILDNTPAIFNLGVFYGFTIAVGGVLLFSGGESKSDQNLTLPFVIGMWGFVGLLTFLYVGLLFIDSPTDVAALLAMLMVEHIARTQLVKDSGSSQGGTPTGGV